MLQVDLLDMLYQKSLRLGIDVRNARGIGTVVNLQSNDASKVWMMPVHIHTLWNSPFQVCKYASLTVCLEAALTPSQPCSLPMHIISKLMIVMLALSDNEFCNQRLSFAFLLSKS